MQTDEEIGKVAAAVPVIISRALELFLESLLTKACHVTQSRNAKTMTTSHLKQCIELEQQFDFLKDLVAAVPDMQGEGEENHTEGEKVPRRGRKPGSGRKNGGAGAKGKDKKLSGTESEQEDDSEDSETDGEEDEDVSHTSTNTAQPAAFFHRYSPNHPSGFSLFNCTLCALNKIHPVRVLYQCNQKQIFKTFFRIAYQISMRLD
uniref:Dr1-associated corepressor-like n=1 Tax=Sinocyclocheilus grahami TaxID=75366 RepID=A0A672KJJ7_SINGR